jgi:carbonic anhydrase/acetyltransferase-like protein (isoleucine patch superfamily)
MPLFTFRDKTPVVGEGVFIWREAVVIGDVLLEEGVNVWPGAVLRGDVERITVRRNTSFQDNSVAHSDPGSPVDIGPNCIVGHSVIVHGARIGEGCLIGMGSTLLNGSVIGAGSIVGANSLVTQGKEFPPRSLIIGSPAKLVREVTDEDLAVRLELSERYTRRAAEYLRLGLGLRL